MRLRPNFLKPCFVAITFAHLFEIHNELATLGERTGPQGISLALSIVGGIVLSSAGYKTGGSGRKYTN
jgi:hypothetical protein